MNLAKKQLYKQTTAQNANTYDILYSLTNAVPAAIAQAVQFNLPELVGITPKTTPIEAGMLTGYWIRANVKYKLDPFNEQNIQLPSSILRTKKADCKSLSLLFLATMEAAGYNAGFRFVSYRKNKSYTHVYNYICFNQNNYFTFDCCIKNLAENQNYKKVKNMRVNYLAGTPVMMGEDDVQGINKPTVEQLMKDDRYMSISGVDYIGRKKLFPKLKEKIRKGAAIIKTVALAPARGPFLVLVDVNFRGLAKKLDKARTKDPKLFEEFWLKLGGKVSSFNEAVNKGKGKKPFLGEKKISGATDAVYIGGPNSICRVDDDNNAIGFDPVTITTALASAGAILAAVQKLFKKLGIKPEPQDGPEIDTSDVPPIAPPGEDFAANDPASPEAETYAKTGKVPELSAATKGGGISFKPSPVMIAAGVGVAALGIYLITKKKGKK